MLIASVVSTFFLQRSRRQAHKRNGRAKLDTSPLKLSLVLGGFFATLIGGEMLARHELRTDSVLVPSKLAVVRQPDGSRWLVSEQPVLELVIPDPVAHSRSSG